MVARVEGLATYGVVTAGQLRAAGVHPDEIARQVRGGRWQRLWRGTYLTRPGPVGPVELAHAAVLHASQLPGRRSPAPPPVLSGLAGARLLQLRWVPPGERVQVLVGPHVQRPSYDLVLVRRTQDLADVRPWRWHGVPVADATRLVVDGARECRSLRDVRGLVLGAVAGGWTTADAVVEQLDRGAVPASAWARRAARDAARGAASPPEAELVDALLGAGMPFLCNPELRLGGRLVCVPDVYLVGTGVGGELDSVERHGGQEHLADTLDRHERADVAGVHLVHVTPQRFRADPAAFLARLRRAVAHRGDRCEPPGLVVLPRGPLLGQR